MSPVSAAQAYAATVQGRAAELAQLEAPPISEGDLTRTTTGWRDGDAWVLLRDEWSVGEYGTDVHTYVLRDGALVLWTSVGHGWDPSDDDDSRFVYFEREQAVGPGQSVLQARARQQWLGSSGMTPDWTAVPWAPMEPDTESVDLAGVLDRFAEGG
jgi:hypothetical protein